MKPQAIALESPAEPARTEERAARRSVVYLCRFAGMARGGAERQALELARSLRERGIGIEVIAEDARSLNTTLPGSECRKLLSTPRVRHVSTLVFWVRVAAHLWRRRREIGVLHLVGIDSEKVFLILVASLLGIRTVVKIMLSGEDGDFDHLGRGLERRSKLAVLRRADRFVAISRRIESEIEALGIPRERIRYLPNGVAARHERASRDEARQRLGVAIGSAFPLDGSTVLAVSAGRLVRQKSFVELLQSFATAAAQAPSARLAIFGEGPLRGEIESQSRALGLSGRVALPGHHSDLPSLLAGADLFVLASRNEGLSNALLEAMAAGLPVVSTRTSGAEDVVRDGIDGLLVEPQCVEGLARALHRLLESREERGRMGASARARILDRFTIDAAADAHCELYQELWRERES